MARNMGIPNPPSDDNLKSVKIMETVFYAVSEQGQLLLMKLEKDSVKKRSETCL